ncbi:hypothetical protein M0804_004594 [Polistes exclamans]|nr:hypothetical protein M0804_004594 [Polistes exclamans]
MVVPLKREREGGGRETEAQGLAWGNGRHLRTSDSVFLGSKERQQGTAAGHARANQGRSSGIGTESR